MPFPKTAVPAPQKRPVIAQPLESFQNPQSAKNPETPNELINGPSGSSPRKRGPNAEGTLKSKRGQSTWTPERRAAAALRASRQKPWLHSTGPKTAEGKSRSRYNAYKHGLNSCATKQFRAALRHQSRFLTALNALITAEKRRRRAISRQKTAINPCKGTGKPPITTPTINLASTTALRAGFISERRKSCPFTRPCLSHGKTSAMRK